MKFLRKAKPIKPQEDPKSEQPKDDKAFIPVVSSNLSAILYEKEEQTLTVEFKTGARYAYLGVPVATFDGLMAAESKGTFLGKEIKPKFKFVKVRQATPKSNEGTEKVATNG